MWLRIPGFTWRSTWVPSIFLLYQPQCMTSSAKVTCVSSHPIHIPERGKGKEERQKGNCTTQLNYNPLRDLPRIPIQHFLLRLIRHIQLQRHLGNVVFKPVYGQNHRILSLPLCLPSVSLFSFLSCINLSAPFSAHPEHSQMMRNRPKTQSTAR